MHDLLSMAIEACIVATESGTYIYNNVLAAIIVKAKDETKQAETFTESIIMLR